MLERPPGLEGGKVLILASADSFTAAYVKRTLETVGVPVTVPSDPPNTAFVRLSAEEWSSIIGCIAVDVGPALFADVEHGARAIPCLFVGSCCGGWFPGPYAWICPPVASYQVVEALYALMPDQDRHNGAAGRA